MYKVYLDDWLLPITPASISRKINNKNETVDLINTGEVNILKRPGLGTFSFEFEIPRFWNLPYIQSEVERENAKWYTDKLYTYKNEKKVIDFIIQRKLPNGDSYYNSNVKVTVEDYTIDEDAENGSDFKIKIDLKQYVEYGTKQINPIPAKISKMLEGLPENWKSHIEAVVKANENGKGEANGESLVNLYYEQKARTDKNGNIINEYKDMSYVCDGTETLQEICKRNYGDESTWKVIQDYNGIADPVAKIPNGVRIYFPYNGYRLTAEQLKKLIEGNAVTKKSAYGIEKALDTIEANILGKDLKLNGFTEADVNWVETVPALAILGYDAKWNSIKKRVIAVTQKRELLLDIQTYISQDNTAFTPLRTLYEYLGFRVNWDKSTKKIIVTE